jgi:3-deoxy-D-manno-octulosonate 8-phosphate phosphatase (KDO 8-P phosphatase)
MQDVMQKAKQIKLLLLDVDGVLTNGIVYYNDEGKVLKGFHIHDGLGLKLLHTNNIETGIITAKHSEAVRHRAKELGIHHVYLGQNNKLPAYDEIKKITGLDDNNIAYMGDDLPDLPILRKVGLAITVPQATAIIKQHAHVVTKHKAGKGAVREACELILEAQGLLSKTLESYLSG